jgi:hypothetical protein
LTQLAGSCQRKRDMRLRITNTSAITLDVHRFSFESAGALGFDNEYSGFAASRKPASYSYFLQPLRDSLHR